MAAFDDEETLTFLPSHSQPRIQVSDWGVATSIGHVRVDNEDAWGHDGLTRFAVADGMGGTAGGRLAATTSVSEFLALDASVGWVPELIELNLRVSRVCHQGGFSAAGSTLIGLEVEPHRCVTIHIGDSRIYRLRSGAFQQLTTDHNLRNLRLEQGLDPDQSDERGAPRALTSWIGAPEEPDRIDIGTLAVESGDRVLLVSDGVSDQLGVEEIAELMGSGQSCETIAEQLVDAADDAGGRDNATALIVELEAAE